MKIGFIGTGALTAAIVTGLKSVADNDLQILLSPRNEAIAAGLAKQFPDAVRVAASNQAVVDGADLVMLAVRPQIANEVLRGVTFRPRQPVISLMATIPLQDVAALVAPALVRARALPMPMVASRMAPTIIYPPDPMTSMIFKSLGGVIEVEDADQFDALGVVTATFAAYFKNLETISSWVAGQGVPETLARNYVTGIYKALAHATEAAPQLDFSELAKDYATRGGVNEQVVRELEAKGVYQAFSTALDNVHCRMTGGLASSD